MSEIKLKPCPCCSGEAVVMDDFGDALVICKICRIQSESERAHLAVKNWNTRPSNWVSVEERLPEVDGYYLVSTKTGKVLITYFWNELVSEGNHWNGKGVIAYENKGLEVLAWQELPQPYKGKE